MKKILKKLMLTLMTAVLFLMSFAGCGEAVQETETQLQKIEIAEQPSVTQYVEGDYFRTAGMKVEAIYTKKGSEAEYRRINVTARCSVPFKILKEGETSVTVSYTDQVTKTAEIAISVAGVEKFAELILKKPPTRSEYTVGECFDPRGMDVEAVYKRNGEETRREDVTKETDVYALPLDGGRDSVEVFYRVGKQTKTLSVPVTVKKGPEKDILFIGDSYIDTNYWTTYQKDFGGYSALNYGVGGTKTQYWTERLLDGSVGSWCDPKSIVLHVGVNDLDDAGMSSAQTTELLRELFANYHAAFPETVIYWTALTPNNHDQFKNYWPKYKQTNADIYADSLKDDKLVYVDIDLGDEAGAAVSQYYVWDGLHFNEAGYALFTAAIKKAMGI